MANEKNLKPFSSDQSREEAAKNGKKGGIASGESKRRKKALKKTIESVLCLDVDPATKVALEQLGVDPSDQSIQTAIVVGQALKAMRGNTKAADFIAKYMGSDPRVEIERERLKLEKERLELQRERVLGATDGEEDGGEDVVIYLPDNGRDDD